MSHDLRFLCPASLLRAPKTPINHPNPDRVETINSVLSILLLGLIRRDTTHIGCKRTVTGFCKGVWCSWAAEAFIMYMDEQPGPSGRNRGRGYNNNSQYNGRGRGRNSGYSDRNFDNGGSGFYQVCSHTCMSLEWGSSPRFDLSLIEKTFNIYPSCCVLDRRTFQ